LQEAASRLADESKRLSWSGLMEGFRGNYIIDNNHLELDIDRLILLSK
jgi:hypothetical protein